MKTKKKLIEEVFQSAFSATEKSIVSKLGKLIENGPKLKFYKDILAGDFPELTKDITKASKHALYGFRQANTPIEPKILEKQPEEVVGVEEERTPDVKPAVPEIVTEEIVPIAEPAVVEKEVEVLDVPIKPEANVSEVIPGALENEEILLATYYNGKKVEIINKKVGDFETAHVLLGGEVIASGKINKSGFPEVEINKELIGSWWQGKTEHELALENILNEFKKVKRNK